MPKNQRLNATVNIGGALSQSFRGAISSSRSQIGRVGDAIKQLNDRQRRLTRVGDHWAEMGRDASQYREEIQRVNTQIGKLRRSQENLGGVMAKQRENLARRSNLRGQMFDVAALGATAALPLTVAAKFEKSMAEVGAVAKSSKAQLGELSKAARHWGATTQFSAIKASQGMKYLAQAGYSQNQILAAMPGMLDVAASGNISLAQASDITSNVLSGFNLKAKETGRVGDVMANGFTAANTNLQQLGEALSYVGPVAADLGYSVESSTAAVGKLSDAGIQGSRAGTALRAIMSRLAGPTAEAGSKLDELGVKTKNAEGDMRPLANIMRDLDDAMAGMGSAARSEINSILFGLEAASGASVLMGKAGSGELQKFTEQMKEAGTAARIAKEINENADGSLKRLKSAGEGVAITIGSLMLPALSSAAEGVADVTNRVDAIAQKFPVVTKAIVGSAVALAGLKAASIVGGYGLTFLRGGLLNVVGAFYRTEAAARAASVSTAGAKAGPTMLGRAFIGLGGGAKSAAMRMPVLGGALRTLGGAFRGAAVGVRALRFALISTGVGAIAVGIGAAAGLIYKYWEPLGAFMSGLWRGIGTAMAPVVDLFGGLLDRLGPVGGAIRAVGTAIGGVIGWFTGLFKPVDTTEQKLKSFGATGEAIGKTIGGVFASIATTIGEKISWTIGKFEAAGNAYSKVKSFFGFGDEEELNLGERNGQAPRVGDAQRQQQAANDEDKGWQDQSSARAPRSRARPRRPMMLQPVESPVQIGAGERSRPEYRAPGASNEEGVRVPPRRTEVRQGDVDARQTVNLTINQQPGEDSQAVADRAVAKMREQDRRERRAALYDDGPAYGY